MEYEYKYNPSQYRERQENLRHARERFVRERERDVKQNWKMAEQRAAAAKRQLYFGDGGKTPAKPSVHTILLGANSRGNNGISSRGVPFNVPVTVVGEGLARPLTKAELSAIRRWATKFAKIYRGASIVLNIWDILKILSKGGLATDGLLSPYPQSAAWKWNSSCGSGGGPMTTSQSWPNCLNAYAINTQGFVNPNAQFLYVWGKFAYPHASPGWGFYYPGLVMERVAVGQLPAYGYEGAQEIPDFLPNKRDIPDLSLPEPVRVSPPGAPPPRRWSCRCWRTPAQR